MKNGETNDALRQEVLQLNNAKKVHMIKFYLQLQIFMCICDFQKTEFSSQWFAHNEYLS